MSLERLAHLLRCTVGYIVKLLSTLRRVFQFPLWHKLLFFN